MFEKKSSKKRKSGNTQMDTVSIDTVIAEKIHIEGHIKGNSSIRIDGKVTGDIEVSPGIVLGENSLVNGNIKSESIVVYGKLNGNINAKDLVIKSTALINGDIFVETLEIDQGGRYNGNLKMDIRQPAAKTATINPKTAKA